MKAQLTDNGSLWDRHSLKSALSHQGSDLTWSGSLGPSPSSSQTASRSVQPFILHSTPYSIPIGLLYSGPPLLHPNSPSLWWICTPSNRVDIRWKKLKLAKSEFRMRLQEVADLPLLLLRTINVTQNHRHLSLCPVTTLHSIFTFYWDENCNRCIHSQVCVCVCVCVLFSFAGNSLSFLICSKLFELIQHSNVKRLDSSVIVNVAYYKNSTRRPTVWWRSSPVWTPEPSSEPASSRDYCAADNSLSCKYHASYRNLYKSTTDYTMSSNYTLSQKTTLLRVAII